MRERTPLADTLRRYMKAKRYSVQRLAKASGVDDATLERWRSGQTKKPHGWSQVVKVAAALELNKAQTNTLLRSAGHRSLEDLLSFAASEEDRALLARWTGAVPNNLPGQLTTFFGREEEIDRIESLLDTARLVTLTGPPGCGKTRLALEAAEAALDRFTDGVFFVGLAPVREQELVIPAISRILGIRGAADEPPMEALKAYLRDRRVLLLLDNFEQVLDAAPLVVELLVAAPKVKALVTSRARLHVTGEHELRVPPLAPPGTGSAFEEWRGNPAVTLFAARARTVDPDFALTAENAPLVAEICARLDGLPLAIELAAARTRRFALRTMLERFPRRLDLGSDGPRDAPWRQRTLRSTLSWSHDLLRPEEDRLFQRLAVFAGGCPEDAAMEVYNLPGDEALDASAALDSLVENNLLSQTAGVGDERRFAMLETIREYALELLESSGELQATSRAHADYYLKLAETAAPEFDGTRQTYWMHRLEMEHDNFRAALQWCNEQGEILKGLRLSTALTSRWHVQDRHIEGRRWLESFLSSDHDVPPALRAKALLNYGLLLMRFAGDPTGAVPLFGEAFALYRESGKLSGASDALLAQGEAALMQGEDEIARARFEECADLAKQAGDHYLTTRAYLAMARCTDVNDDFEKAVHYWNLTLEWAQKASNPANIALALNGLGEMERHRGNLDAAHSYYEQCLDVVRELGSEWREAMPLHNLGYIALHRGELDRARGLFAKSLMLHETRQYKVGIGECLAGLAATASAQGRLERSARLCGASEALLQSLGAQLDTVDWNVYEQARRVVCSQLGDERFEALLAEGRAMTMEQATKYTAKS